MKRVGFQRWTWWFFLGKRFFHRPHEGWTGQLGSGAHLHAALNGVPVVCDLRSLDVAYHGQGAPLVPIVEEHLYASFEGCLNLGRDCKL